MTKCPHCGSEPIGAGVREALEKRVRELEKLIYVPGLWSCAKCKFQLVQSSLNANDGTVTARDTPGNKCPNCNGPLWRVTERQAGNDMVDRCTEQMERALKAEKELAALALSQSPAPGKEKTMTENQIKHMTNRFLGWKLPANFSPDAGISFKAAFNEHTAHPMKHESSGTNLFDAMQAEAVVRYMIEGLPEDKSDAK